MTIYGAGYRPLQAPLVGRVRRLLPLFRAEFTSLFRTRMGLLGFLVALAPSIVNLVVLLVRFGVLRFVNEHAPRRPRGARLPIDVDRWDPASVRFYLEPIIDQFTGMAVFLILTGLVASRAIAKDRPTNALELYWTRGISPFGYFMAKWLGSFCLLATAMVLLPFLLWLTGVMLAEDWDFLQDTIAFVPGMVAALTCFTLVLSFLSVGLSALAASANMASVLWCMLLSSGAMVAHLVAVQTQSPTWVGACSVWDAARTLALHLAGLQHPEGTLTGALALLGLSVAVVGLLVRRRLRLREAIG